MAISLQKGGNVNLSKEAPTMSKMVVGLGWDTRATDGAAFDLDAVGFVLGANGKVRADSDFIFFNNKQNAEGSVLHGGDNRTGEGDGDDEQITVSLPQLPANVKSLVFTVSSFRGQTFEKVENAFCRLVDQSSRQEIAKYSLSTQGAHTALIIAKIYRHNNEWKMHAIGESTHGRTFDQIIPHVIPHI